MSKIKKNDFKAEYDALSNAKHRCTNPKHAQWKDYGGRGITVDPTFLGPDGFANFLAAVGPKPRPELTLDRVSNEMGYVVGNLAWTSRSVQQRNRRPNKVKVADLGWGLKAHLTKRGDGQQFTSYSPIVPLGDRRQSLREWSAELGISAKTIQQRLQRGVPPEQALVSTLFSPWGKPRNSDPTVH
jgi:hypothetical protein